MLRIAGVGAILLTGCMVDSIDEIEGTPIPDEDLIGRICTMQMTVTGSFVESTPAPPDPEDGTPYSGCWPIGVWTFQAQRGETDCETPPLLLNQYQFKVELKIDADGLEYQSNSYMTDPSVRHRVKVSQGGDGLCEGELDLFSADGKEVWIIKPELYADKHLGGSGEYSLHHDDQWIGDL
jgi:hypothetical protein